MGDHLKQSIFCGMVKIMESDEAVRSVYLRSKFFHIKTGCVCCKNGVGRADAVQLLEYFCFNVFIFEYRFNDDIRIGYRIEVGGSGNS